MAIGPTTAGARPNKVSVTSKLSQPDNVVAQVDFLFQLPDELLIHICSFLSGEDVCALSQVCKRGQEIASDAAIWIQLLIRSRSSVMVVPKHATTWKQVFFTRRDFDSIQGAVDSLSLQSSEDSSTNATNPNHVIFVRSGIYYENIVLSSASVHIVGEGVPSPVSDLSGVLKSIQDGCASEFVQRIVEVHDVAFPWVADYSSGEANVKPRRKVSGPTVTSIQEAPLLRVKYANRSGFAKLQGLTFSPDTSDLRSLFCIDVESGMLDMSDCIIWGHTLSCVLIHTTANVKMCRNVIKGSDQCGILAIYGQCCPPRNFNYNPYCSCLGPD